MPAATTTSLPPGNASGQTRVKDKNWYEKGRDKARDNAKKNKGKGPIGTVLDAVKPDLPEGETTDPRKVCASNYGWPGESDAPACPPGKMYFAELSTNPEAGENGCDFKAMGDLPKGAIVKVRNPENGKVVSVEKNAGGGHGPVGCGGGPCPDGSPRVIDLCPTPWQALGFKDQGIATVELIGGSGEIPVVSDVIGGVTDLAGILKSLFSTEGIMKIGKVLLGALAIALAVMVLARELAGGQAARVLKGVASGRK